MPDLREHPLLPPEMIAVRALGCRVGIRPSGPGARAFSSAFSHAWGQLLDEHSSALDVIDEREITVPDTSATTVARVAVVASSEITHAAIEGNIGTGLLLHAAAMVQGPGATLLIGPSGAGKTTAIGHFGRHHGYLTDEIALIRPNGRVARYPKPLEVIGDSDATRRLVTPGELGLVPAPDEEMPVKRLIILDRRPDLGAPTTARLGLLDGILALVPRISRLNATPDSLALLARRIAEVGGVELLSYESIDDLDPRSGPPTSAPLSAVELEYSLPLADPVEPPSRPLEQERSVVRSPADDAIDISDTLLVASDDRVSALVGVSRSIWLETAQPRSVEGLLASLRRTHGEFEGDADITASVVRQLTEHGILRWLE